MWHTVLWLCLLALCVFCICSCIKPSNFPPGPHWYPLLGCLPIFQRLRTKHGYMHLACQELAAEYGPVLGLKFGKQRLVVVSSYDLAKEVLLQEEFSGRPDGFFFRVRAFGKRKGVLFSEGSHWYQHRRFSMRHLRIFGLGQAAMENYLTVEARSLVEHLRKLSESGPVPMHTAFDVSVINALWVMFAGHRFEYDDRKTKEVLKVSHDAFRLMDTLGGVLSQMPFLRFVTPELSGYNELMSILEKLWAFLDEEIEAHELALSSDQPRDLIDAFLIEIGKNGSPDSIFNREDLIILCLDLFLAGSETTSNTLANTIMYLALYPEWLTTLQRDLEAVVGRDRPPTIADRQSLPTIDAFLAEVLRYLVLAPLGVPHRTTKDTTLGGYSIPKDTIVVINLQSIHSSEAYWDKPKEFRPERFLNAEGQFRQSDHAIPFGMGKRRCLGESLARASLFLFFTYLIHYFDFEISPEHGAPNPHGYDGFTVSPRPFHLKLSARADVKD